MSVVARARAGIGTVLNDPVGRRAYLARLKWLVNGSGAVPAHSLEYRAGLTGRWAIPVERLATDDEAFHRCPGDCGAHSPMSHLYEQRSVYRLRRTVASTMSGATLMCGAQEPPFFVRESITWPFESILSHGLEVPEVGQVDERIVGDSVVFPTTANYYHWLIEDLPVVLRAAQVAPDAGYLSFAEGITDRHRAVADLLGLRLVPSPLIVALDEQVLPGRADGNWFIHPADAALLREFGSRLTGSSPTSGDGRIYVSRRGTGRSLPDEERLEGELAERGFAIVHPETMSWPDQIRLFQQARTVVAPHGAGLSNLVFTPAGATLVEITFGLHYNRCFEWLAHIAGHRYVKVDGDASDAPVVQPVLDALP